jgi:hypothetical protein
MMEQYGVDLSHLSPQDRKYVTCPSFETHIISGIVFAVGYTVVFVVPVLINFAALFWPGIIVATVVSLIVMKKVQRREFFVKLREVERDPTPHPEEKSTTASKPTDDSPVPNEAPAVASTASSPARVSQAMAED